MAENEILDFGHLSRWRRSRAMLREPSTTLDGFVSCASDDFIEALRKLPAALRKGPALVTLLRAAEESPSALQEVVAAFKEKRIAKLALAASELAKNGGPAYVAQTATRLLIDGLVDQISLRAKRERRFCSLEEQRTLRASLVSEFNKCADVLSGALESSIRGKAVKSIKRALPALAPIHPGSIARMSLVTSRPERPHAHR